MATVVKDIPRAGQEIEGFTIGAVTPLPEIRAVAIRAEHRRSGAQFLHVYSETDTENCFAVTFPTPPADDTGLPHIMEHAVLGGSRRFPVREPFFEMVKMSMATFINAMTAQAYTVYPVASNVKKDFFNLVEVYLDAVFHPELKEDTFRREGHHLALVDNADLSTPLTVSGIVYNEMKGAYSSPESLMHELASRGLFPDTPLGRDSGGDPDRIPDLTYEQFLRFHREAYRPSNALIFVYGDIPTSEHLHFLGPTLDGFERAPVRVSTPRQPRWLASRQVEREYPVGPDEDLAGRSFCTLNWLVGDGLDAAAITDWEVIWRLLLGNDAAPLKKAIVDSQLGADVFFSGTWASAYEQSFHVGIKGTEADRAGRFEELVLSTLARVSAGRFPDAQVDAAFQQLAYDTLEVKTLFPLHVLQSVNGFWPFGGDPLTGLRAAEHLAASRARHDADPERFSRLVREGLVDNPHRLRAVLRPDRGAQSRADAAVAARMATRRAALSADEVARIAREAAALDAAQGVPNPPEALARLPQLKVSDLPANPRRIPTQVGRVAGFPVLRNDVFANGVNYLEADIDLAGLPSELYAWLPRFSDVLNKMGAAGHDYARIAERRAACTGGLWGSTAVWRHAADPLRTLRRFRLGVKTLDGQTGEALRLLADLVFAADPRDRDRLRDVTVQARAWYRTALVNDGLGTARRQALRGLSPEGAIEHCFSSPASLRAVEALAANFDARFDEIVANVERIRDFLLNRARWTFSFTGSDGAFRTLTRELEEWGARMRHEAVIDAPPAFAPFASPPREGWAGPMRVAHCVKAMPALHVSDPDAPLFRLGVSLAAFDYFLPEIRFKGNAYGGGVQYDDASSTLFMYSFRDPRIVETLDVFANVRDFIAAQRWSQADIDRAIIGGVKEVERPIRPGDATGTALGRHVRGDTDELRDARYAATLRATPGAVRDRLLAVLDAHSPRAAVCVVSSREKLDEANRGLGEQRLDVEDILP